MLAERGGNVTSPPDQSGAVKLRIVAQRNLLKDILELDDDQRVCLECHAVQDEDEEWQLPRYCPDCRDGVQKQLGDIAEV
jgi:hypothetical protein